MKKGKIIVIDGMDGTGKETQSKLLYEKLKEKSDKVMICDLPNYESDSSYFVKKYLREGYTRDIDLPLLHDSFYAIDRAITYYEKVNEKYEDGYTIIFDRYIISNAIFRLHRFEKMTQKIVYLLHLLSLETRMLKIPAPDINIILYSEPEVNLKLLESRSKETGECKDLNESKEIQEIAYNNIKDLTRLSAGDSEVLNDALKLLYKDLGPIETIKIHDEDNNIYSIENIHEKIIEIINSI